MIRFQDKAAIGTVRDSADGYLVAVSRVARTGVQDYLARELGDIAKDREPDSIVKVNRAEGEVFNKDSMSSLTHAPVTVNHPEDNVNAANWKDLAVGEVGEGVLRDGEWLSVSLIVKDQDGINAARNTHPEISMGYTAEIVDAPEGADYDYDMKNIQFNHLALVKRGRAGSEARIGDDTQNWGVAPTTTKDADMSMKTVVFGDHAVEVAAKDADTVTRILKDHKAEVDALNKVIEDKDTTIGELKAENADTAKKVLSDADIEKRVEERAAVVDKAIKLDPKAKVKGKSLADIRRDAVRGMYGDEAAAADISDAEIKGIFSVMKLDDTADSIFDREGKDYDEDEEEMMGRRRRRDRKKVGDSWSGFYKEKDTK